MLHSRDIPVTYLIREKHFWSNVLPLEESQMIDNHLASRHINLRPETELEEIIDNGSCGVKAIKTKSGEIIECQFVGLTVGVHPNIDFLKDSKLEIDKGILVNDLLATNIKDVYAIGDCAQLRQPLGHRKPIEAVWYAGRMMGETVARTIADSATKYVPGIWFNSAKFFDIEYQTYGNVPAHPSDSEDSFYWEHADRSKCLRVVFDQSSRAVKGVNTFGIRQRHEIWDEWIKKGKTLKYVMEHLPKGHFDPEFFTRYEGEIQAQYNNQFPTETVATRKRGFLERILS